MSLPEIDALEWARGVLKAHALIGVAGVAVEAADAGLAVAPPMIILQVEAVSPVQVNSLNPVMQELVLSVDILDRNLRSVGAIGVNVISALVRSELSRNPPTVGSHKVISCSIARSPGIIPASSAGVPMSRIKRLFHLRLRPV